MRPFRAYYFLIFAGMAFFTPFLTLYYEEIGLSGAQIGMLAATPSLITFISAPTFGAIADVFQHQKRILGFSIFMVIVGIVTMSLGRSFSEIIPGVFLYAFFFAPALPLIDRSVLEVLGTDRDQYGKQRLWGAIGWGVLAPVAGVLVEFGGLKWAFYGAAILFGLLLIVSQNTPIRQVRIHTKFISGLSQLFAKPQVAIFFGVILIGGIGLAMIHHYLFLFLNHLSASPIIMGSSLTVATISELVVMYYSDRILKSWKARGLIAFGMAMIALRLIGLSVATSPWMVLVIQLLHGPTFAAVWMAGVAYIADIAPVGLGNTAQGIFTGIVMGLGSALGAFLGGYLYQSVGFSRMFIWTAISVLAAFSIFMVGLRSER